MHRFLITGWIILQTRKCFCGIFSASSVFGFDESIFLAQSADSADRCSNNGAVYLLQQRNYLVPYLISGVVIGEISAVGNEILSAFCEEIFYLLTVTRSRGSDDISTHGDSCQPFSAVPRARLRMTVSRLSLALCAVASFFPRNSLQKLHIAVFLRLPRRKGVLFGICL